MCVRGLGQTNFLPVIYAYIQSRRRERFRTGVVARIGYGYISPRVSTNLAQIGTDDATRLWWNLRLELVYLVPEQQVNACHVCAGLRINNICTLFYDGKMCECTQIFHRKCDDWANIHMKNVNDVDFDTNINRDMCTKVIFLFIDIKPRIFDKYIYLYHAYCHLHHLCAWWCRWIC